MKSKADVKLWMFVKTTGLCCFYFNIFITNSVDEACCSLAAYACQNVIQWYNGPFNLKFWSVWLFHYKMQLTRNLRFLIPNQCRGKPPAVSKIPTASFVCNESRHHEAYLVWESGRISLFLWDLANISLTVDCDQLQSREQGCFCPKRRFNKFRHSWQVRCTVAECPKMENGEDNPMKWLKATDEWASTWNNL